MEAAERRAEKAARGVTLAPVNIPMNCDVELAKSAMAYNLAIAKLKLDADADHDAEITRRLAETTRKEARAADVMHAATIQMENMELYV